MGYCVLIILIMFFIVFRIIRPYIHTLARKVLLQFKIPPTVENLNFRSSTVGGISLVTSLTCQSKRGLWPSAYMQSSFINGNAWMVNNKLCPRKDVLKVKHYTRKVCTVKWAKHLLIYFWLHTCQRFDISIENWHCKFSCMCNRALDVLISFW